MKLTFAIAVLTVTANAAEHVVNQTTCGGKTYKYTGLAGYGFVPSNATDKYGDTIGGIGSSIAFDQSAWRKTSQYSYSGTVYATPDRGWNTNGTLNFQSRIHKFAINLKLAPNATPKNPSNPNVNLKYLDTILLTGPDGHPLTALDADVSGHASYPGPGGKRVSVDSEGLALDTRDGGFWVSDEYGPYIYKFNAEGRMVHAIQPPEAYLPRRNGTLSFNSNSPPLYNPQAKPVPIYTESGRNNNQGFEGVTVSADGKMLYVLVQSSLNQEGGPEKVSRSPVRLLAYDISVAEKPVLVHEYVVMLPKYWDYTEKDAKKAHGVASQSEIHQLPSGDFLVLARDSGFGRGQKNTRSVYRHADVFSLKGKIPATDLKGKKNYDDAHGAIASSEGVLFPGIVPAEYCSFVDYNVNSELGKFRLHNGGPSDEFLLNEKWESLAVVPANPSSGGAHRGADGEYFLFSFSDNDFMTQDGHLDFGKLDYKDASGYNLDTQVLVFKLKF
ncbi:uncharacterized protein N7529_006696 [Penicillium soppii]|uniref:uncharacterized protein n=1 Tax=Penicillium soppii TaxID=69789 RepID=UPI002547CC04|nr:uncharacterized protein N7529_006696 [Penicillium soppii]KAJ5864780.1 hypothetical protein N7529_006696 [Penicillium soppii]